MPPSPGKIHSLPVKVLYSLDTTSQSYLAVLHDRQDVYVHPGQPGYATSAAAAGSSANDRDQGPVGSCSLKAVARGICFASPECIPNASNLDFSVYNLDPSGRRPSSRAFPSSPGDPSSSWSGRGFLSWALSEQGGGSTLIKGRLVREYEFSSTHFAPEGGLEGLMAAAQAQANGTSEEMDGKGWGLEVGISLRQLNPEGKVEFTGRREFEEMLAKGRSLSSSVTPSSPVRALASTPNAIPRSSPHPGGAPRFSGTPTVSGTPQPGPSASSTATVRPPVQHAQPSPVPIAASHHNQSLRQTQSQIHPQPSSRPSSSLSHRPSSTTMPPSSLPALPSSSNMPSSRPSSSAGDSRQSTKPELPPQPPTQPAESSRAALQRSREVTPPPLPRPKSPPPSTPSRAKLHALLRADGMMSPDLARHLASNPVLRNLLKAVPNNSSALTALRSITGINNPTGSGTGGAAGLGPKGKAIHINDDDDDDGKGGSPESPTPSAPPQLTPGLVRSTTDGCCNCGTTVSSCWRTKKMKDGTPRKVCDDCGLYFNEHKRMRPPELWGQSQKNAAGPSALAASSSSNDPKRKLLHDPFADGPAAGLRSSPRLHRSNSDKDTHHPVSHGHAHPPPHTLPHSTQIHSHGHGHDHAALHGPPESPRKRQKIKAAPPPSPRRATRAATKADPNLVNMDFSAEAFGFSPNTMFGTSPAVPQDSNASTTNPSIAGVMSNFSHHGDQNGMASLTNSLGHHANGNGNGNGPGLGHHDPNLGHGAEGMAEGDIDLTAFLNQMEGSTDGFSLDSLFTGLGEGAGVELSQEMMDLIAGWENHAGGVEMGDGLLGDHTSSSAGAGAGAGAGPGPA